MSFQLNNAQQMAINDSLLSLIEREMKHLISSWAETFSKKIFLTSLSTYHQDRNLRVLRVSQKKSRDRGYSLPWHFGGGTR